ncbi:MAG: serine/threonine-protein kinase [Thermoguttaceae bacterium]|jgi:serine/threonine-protein kinase
MVHIRLHANEWEYDPAALLGPAGGFGEVFKGTDRDGNEVAVKRLKVSASEAAHRELRLAEELAGKAFGNVIRVLDSGQDSESDSYFIVMPRAEKSLRDDVDAGRRWSDQEAAGVLLEIVNGLEEVGTIVHRDLKPGNVLFHDGRWKIADFGIARFIEESTSLRTLKDCLTKPFAAPEQWLDQTATAATDLYALGCIAHVLLTGRPPFCGPNYREQHLTSNPPQLEEHHPLMASLASMLLRKQPQSRPTRDRVTTLLQRLRDAAGGEASRGAAAELAEVNRRLVTEAATRESKEQEEEFRGQERHRLAADAQASLRDGIVERLLRKICDAAPAAKCAGNDKAQPFAWSRSVSLGEATLAVAASRVIIPQGPFGRAAWELVAGAQISISAPSCESSASLWYGSPAEWSGCRWFEVAYCTNPAVPSGKMNWPFALTNPAEAAEVGSGGAMGTRCVAYPPRPIDDEDEADFCERWLSIFTKAAGDKLKSPRDLPLADSIFR